jgi:hypothetical protein
MVSEHTEPKSPTSPLHASENSSFFNISRDHDLPPIPPCFDTPLLDNAVEFTEADLDSTTAESFNTTTESTTPYKPNFNGSPPPPLLPTPPPKYSQDPSLSYNQTLFHSIINSPDSSSSTHSHSHSHSQPNPTRPTTSPSNPTGPSKSSRSRNRALSSPILQLLPRSTTPPEADIHDDSTSHLVLYAPSTPPVPVARNETEGESEPDPFRANATTYYTPQTLIPSTPPRRGPSSKDSHGSEREPGHAKKLSREEDLIVTLRTQVALQSELCAQYEVDLRARDELVDVLARRLEGAEREGEKRRGVLKGWRKKVAELERACRHLEEAVDLSRQESLERSVIDEASGAALRVLHVQIAGLEREKGEGERREEVLKGEVGVLEGLVKERTDEAGRLREELEKLKEEKAVEAVNEGERERYRAEECAWEEERKKLSAQVSQSEKEKADIEEELRAQVKVRDDELGVLKRELEAQWAHTEEASEKIDALVKERDALRGDVKALEDRIESLEVEWAAGENKRGELEERVREVCGEREVVVRERDEVSLCL